MFVTATFPFLIRLKVLPTFPLEVFRIFGIIDQRDIRLRRWTPNPEKIFQVDAASCRFRSRYQTRASSKHCDGGKDRPTQCAWPTPRPLCFVTRRQKISFAVSATSFGPLVCSATDSTDTDPAFADQGYHDRPTGDTRCADCVAAVPMAPWAVLIVSFLQHSGTICRFFTKQVLH